MHKSVKKWLGVIITFLLILQNVCNVEAEDSIAIQEGRGSEAAEDIYLDINESMDINIYYTVDSSVTRPQDYNFQFSNENIASIDVIAGDGGPEGCMVKVKITGISTGHTDATVLLAETGQQIKSYSITVSNKVVDPAPTKSSINIHGECSSNTLIFYHTADAIHYSFDKENVQYTVKDLTFREVIISGEHVIETRMDIEVSTIGKYCLYFYNQNNQVIHIVEFNVTAHEWKEEETSLPTCSDIGQQNYVCTICGFERIEEIPKLGHEFSEDWTIDKEPTCMELGSKSHHCVRCNEQRDNTEIPMLEHEFSKDWTVEEEPTCTEAGRKSHRCIWCGKLGEVEIIHKLNHNYGAPYFIWSVDNDSCEGVFSCDVCGNLNKVMCDVIVTHKDATCTACGEINYTANCIYNNIEYQDVKKITTLAKGHKYSIPKYEWSEDSKICKAIFTCTDCNEQQTIECFVNETEILAPKCEGEGVSMCNATCKFQNEEYSIFKVKINAATGHSYGEPNFLWSENIDCMAEFNCSVCNNIKKVVCTVSEDKEGATCTEAGKIVYTAMLSGMNYTDVKEVKIPAYGHAYKYEENGGRTHIVTCKNCDIAFSEGCTFHEYVCVKCGAKDMKVISPVTNLKAQSAGRNKVTLFWNSSGNADGYLIYAQKKGKYGYCGMTTKDTMYTDTKALDTAYNFYWVYPYVEDSSGNKVVGKCIHYVYAKGVTLPVTNLKAANQKGSVKLTWTKSFGADGYLIYGKTASGKYGYISMKTKETTYLHRNASKKEYNFYWVYPYHYNNGKRIVGHAPKYVYGKAK